MSVVRTSQGFKRKRNGFLRRAWLSLRELFKRLTPEERYIRDYRRKHPDRVPFVVDGKCILSDEKLLEHAAVARKSGFQELTKAQIPPYRESLLIVGSGLSVIPLLPEIKARNAPIMALKSSHDWLIQNGVVPTYAVASDPQQSRHDCFKSLRDDVIYFMASQMHPETWGYMKGRKVILWHSEIDLKHRTLPDYLGIPLVPGGPTTGLRAISLAYILGFRNIELYGYDSCVKDGVYKIDGSPMREGDSEHEVWSYEEGPFTVLTSMIPQVTNLMHTLMPWPGLKVQAHGEGYFQSALRQGKAQGWPV